VRRVVTAFAALLVFVVVVCPLTPTPVAVVGAQGPMLHAAPAALAAAVTFFLAPRLEAASWLLQPAHDALDSAHDILRLTCVLLC